MYVKVGKENVVYEAKSLSDTSMCILFTVFISFTFLLMFSYADNFSHQSTENSPLQIRSRNRHRNFLDNDSFSAQNYTWICRNFKCERFVYYNGQRDSLDTCNMLCSSPPIWPKPKKVSQNSVKFSVISKDAIYFNIDSQDPARSMLFNATNTFLENLKDVSSLNKTNVTINIRLLSDTTTKLKLTTLESYKLSIGNDSSSISVKIYAENFFGARHGLETLSQLIWYDDISNELKILIDLEIEDSPSFPYRGVMLDTARNYFSLDKLKRVVDGMAASKLNVFHLHLTDAVSFPIVLPSIKELAEFGAYGSDKIYTPKNIKDLVEYARLRGIRVVLEIDSPSHVNAGWNYAKEFYNENLVICGENDIFKGHLNPDNDRVLDLMEDIYGDLLELSNENEIFHIGGDEVNLDCWKNTDAAKGYSDMTQFWADYNNQIIERLKIANGNRFPKNIIVWSSPLTNSKYLKELYGNITVQFWLGNPNNVLSNKNYVIYSTVGHWYLDCGFGLWKPDMGNGVCDPYTPWQTVYKYRPWKEYGHIELTLGGEVCLWTEQVEVDTLETRLWPRSAAFAERVWSDPVKFDNYDVYTRMVSFRERLMSRGIKASGIWPRWCSQNPGKCGFPWNP